MKNFNGQVLFLDRADINTDEIIPARYLTEITKEALKPYLLEDLKFEGFDPETDICGQKRYYYPVQFRVRIFKGTCTLGA